MIPAEKKILNLYRSMNDEGKSSLFNFAQYLSEKHPGNSKKAGLLKIEIEPAPDESVIAALKRLKMSYPMIESTSVLNRASELLTSHMMHGRDKKSVIEDLENLFLTTYNDLKNQR